MLGIIQLNFIPAPPPPCDSWQDDLVWPVLSYPSEAVLSLHNWDLFKTRYHWIIQMTNFKFKANDPIWRNVYGKFLIW